jgi:hypothetical protein
MKKGTYVYCTTQFEGFHKWPDAPSNVAFLRTLHRHIFHVKITVNTILDNNRNVEFIGLKRNVDFIIVALKKDWLPTISCEMMAEDILEDIEKSSTLKVHSVEVSEDGENGAIVVCQ